MWVDGWTDGSRAKIQNEPRQVIVELRLELSRLGHWTFDFGPCNRMRKHGSSMDGATAGAVAVAAAAGKSKQGSYFLVFDLTT